MASKFDPSSLPTDDAVAVGVSNELIKSTDCDHRGSPDSEELSQSLLRAVGSKNACVCGKLLKSSS